MEKEICFYLKSPCRYSEDAPLEEQMDCSTCPAYISFMEKVEHDRLYSAIFGDSQSDSKRTHSESEDACYSTESESITPEEMRKSFEAFMDSVDKDS